MEAKSSSCGANLLPTASYGFQDLQRSTQVQQPSIPQAYQTSMVFTSHGQDVFNLREGNFQEPDQALLFTEYSKREGKRISLSDDDDEEEEMNCVEEGMDGVHEIGKGKKGLSWQRVKWTDKMVMLLITAVSYIGDDPSSDLINGGLRRKTCILQKKGKWKTVSKVMAERGLYVSPQQCEDKFNDLNKRYKRLNDVLGRGTSCEVVENPKLLEVMDLSAKAKEDVRKILSSKHLFYEQMCSYHNGNRLHLPHDLDLQRSLQFALRSKDDCEYELPESKQRKGDDFDEGDHDIDFDDQDDAALGFANTVNFFESEKRSDVHNPIQGSRSDSMMKHSLLLQEKKLAIQEQMLELEQQRLKLQRFSKKQERELVRMRLENERFKLENERMGLELKRMTEFNAK